MNEPVRHPVYEFDGFRLDTRRRVLFGRDRQPITLTARVLDTLVYFVERPGQLLTKKELLAALWPNLIVEEHNLNKTVSELRRALGEKPGEHRFIVTTSGRGYRFVANVSVALTAAAPEETRSHPEVDTRLHEPTVETGAAASATAPSRKTHRHRAAVWSAAVAAATAVAVSLVLWPAREPPLRVTPWSVKKGTQWFPAWSPDSASTVFTTFGGVLNEPPELVIRDLGEPVARRIARRPAIDPGGVTQWTKAGKILYFDLAGLWSISQVGGQPEHLVALDYERIGVGRLWLRMAHVSSDGSTLAAFARDGEDSVAIWTATPPSATLERYAPAPFEGATFYGGPYMRFSPNGRQLLLAFYVAGRGLEAWLMPFPPDARNPPRRVLENMPILGNGVEFSWLPDERHVVLSAAVGAADEGLRRQLYIVNTQSGNFRVLTAGFNNPSIPVVSPDGSKLIVQDGKVDFDIVTLDLSTATLTTTIATDRSEILPAWAADTDAMVYATDRSGAWEIWLHQAPQPDRPLVTARDFPEPTLLLFAPTLSPDATRVIVHRVEAEGDESRLWIASVDGGEPEPLTNEELTERAGSWSPDGDWYVYWASPPEGGRRTLKRVRTTGRAAPETILEDLEFARDIPAPIWSPDGQWILVAHQGLTLISADGRQTLRNLGSEAMPCAFADNEPLLYCIRGGLEVLPLGEYALLELDFNGNVRSTKPLPSAFRPVSQLTPGIRLSPTPDRTGVTYSVENVSQTLWLVEGLDRVPLP